MGKHQFRHFVDSFGIKRWELMAINIGTTGIEGSWSAPLNYTTPDPVKAP